MQPRILSWVARPDLIILFLCLLVFGTSPARAMETPPVHEETIAYFLTDHLGSTDTVLDENGEVVIASQYQAFGADAAPNSTAEPHKYTGKELDSETGLYYYGARYYDAETGRFISEDPVILMNSDRNIQSILGNPQSLNPYSYAFNSPISLLDPNGEYTEPFHYTLSFYLGIEAGLNQQTASDIAWFDQRMDTDPNTSPGANLKNYANGNNSKYHFVPRSVTIARLTQAIKDQNKETFGQALHSFQDTYSHADISQPGHAMKTLLQDYLGIPLDPDDPQNDIHKAMEAAYQSYLYERAYKKAGISFKDGDEEKKFDSETSSIWDGIDIKVLNHLVDYDNSAITKEIDKISGKEDDEDSNN